MTNRDDDAVLADLARHPGWEVLKERLKERRQREALVVAQQILSGSGPVDQALVDRQRGYAEGIQAFVKWTEAGLRRFEKQEEGEA